MRVLQETHKWSSELAGVSDNYSSNENGLEDTTRYLVELALGDSTLLTRLTSLPRAGARLDLQNDALCALELICEAFPVCAFDVVIEQHIWPRYVVSRRNKSTSGGDGQNDTMRLHLQTAADRANWKFGVSCGRKDVKDKQYREKELYLHSLSQNRCRRFHQHQGHGRQGARPARVYCGGESEREWGMGRRCSAGGGTNPGTFREHMIIMIRVSCILHYTEYVCPAPVQSKKRSHTKLLPGTIP